MVFLVAMAAILILSQCVVVLFIKRRHPAISRVKLMSTGALVTPPLLFLLLFLGFVEDALMNDDPLDDAPQRSMFMLAMVSPLISIIFAPLGVMMGWLVHCLGRSTAAKPPETFE